jgi:hypothetical protein
MYPDDTFSVELEFYKASFGTLARSLNGKMVAQVTLIYTDEEGMRWMNVCNRQFHAAKGDGEWVKGMRAEMIMWTFINATMEKSKGRERTEDEKRKLIRKQAGDFFTRFQSHADACHLTNILPDLCMAGEKSVLLEDNSEGREGREWITGGVGRLMKMLRPVFISLSEVNWAGEAGEGIGDWDPRVWRGRPKRDLFWPQALSDASLPLTRERVRPGHVYVISSGFQTLVMPTLDVGKDELKRYLESPSLKCLLEYANPGGLIVVPYASPAEKTANSHPDAKRFYELLYLDRTPSCPFTMDDYTRFLEQPRGRAGLEYGPGKGQHVVGLGKGKVARAGEGRFQTNYNYNHNPGRPPPTKTSY